jgi:transcriptional regulator with XRE-family HTH domain
MTPEQMFRGHVGRRLKAERKRAKLSQSAIAARVDVHRNAVGRWENGDHAIDLFEFVKLCEGLDRRPEDVLAAILAPHALELDRPKPVVAVLPMFAQICKELGLPRKAKAA